LDTSLGANRLPAVIHNVAELREQAERCRRLAKTQTNKDVAAKLRDIASQFDEMADVLEKDAREG
jgi:hypothetical protein